ncbi:MAG: hypothetical protein GF334_04905 [Candidatus Altiarchaeales archaeon]|nr:hypothetical protein [Candidatus Altiarchaeales archaeon]
MPKVEEHKRLIKFIDTALANKGEHKGSWMIGTFTAKELLLGADMGNTENNWRYVIHVMKTFYPDSTWERGSRDEGFKIRVRTRIK